ncbi:hypothetical protein PMIN03_012606 [Paraphaeosphaeria minitans]
MLRLALLRQVLNNTSSDAAISLCQTALPGIANSPNVDFPMQDRSSSGPPPSGPTPTLTDAESCDPQSYRTPEASVKIEMRRSSEVAVDEARACHPRIQETPS